MNDDITIELPNFEGPLDLLLHLIKSQEIDIYDIPIAQITSQYLDYLDKMQELNLQLAGEFFVMAATLLRIKSQYLLPKNDFVEEEEYEDPRDELVEQLVQYSVFKKVSAYFKERNEEVPITVAKEPSVSSTTKIHPLPMGKISESELVNTFALAMRRFKLKNPENATVSLTGRPIQDMVTFLQEKLSGKKSQSFFELVDQLSTLADLVGLFLAILELVKDHRLKVVQSRTFGDIELQSINNE